METPRIAPFAISRTSLAPQKAIPTQGAMLHQTLVNLAKAMPATGKRDATAEEIAAGLQLSPEDTKRFIPLVISASISSAAEGGNLTLVLSEEFRHRPHPEGREMIFKQVFRGTISAGKLEVSEGLAAVVGFVNTNIKKIEDANEGGKAGVRVVAGLGTEFFPI